MQDIISIIIPTKDRKDSLKRTIGSILDQEGMPYAKIEIVIVDDGSTDHTYEEAIDPVLVHLKSPDWLRQRKSVKLTYTRNSETLGPAESRNKGIRASTGNYIMFLDSDDELYSVQSVRTLYEHIASLDKPALVYGQTLMFKQIAPDVWRPQHLFSLPLFSQEHLVKSGGVICMGSFIVPRSIFEDPQNLFTPGLALASDYEWQLRISQQISFMPVQEIILRYYRKDNGQVSSQLRDEKSVEATHALIKKHTANLEQGDAYKTRLSFSGGKMYHPTGVNLPTPEECTQIPVDLIFEGQLIQGEPKAQILWILDPHFSVAAVRPIAEDYKVVITTNCAYSYQLEKALRRRVHTLYLPYETFNYVTPYEGPEKVDTPLLGKYLNIAQVMVAAKTGIVCKIDPQCLGMGLLESEKHYIPEIYIGDPDYQKIIRDIRAHFEHGFYYGHKHMIEEFTAIINKEGLSE